MSLKIYDAYRMNIRTVQDIHSFTQKLKTYQSKAMMEYLIGHMAAYAARLTDTLCLNKHPIEGINPPENLIRLMENHPNINQNRTLFSNTLAIVNDHIEDRRKQWFEEQSLCVFPQDENHICAMVFGKPLTHLFQTYHNGKADKQQTALFNDIQLEDYHYQNQTDRPENITENEWETRCTTWKHMMPSLIPDKDGILIMIITQNAYENMLYQITYDDLLKHPNLDKKHRAKNLAYNSALNEYVYRQADTMQEEISMSDYLRFDAQFRTETKNQESEVAKRICQITDLLMQTLPDITTDLLSTPIANIPSS